MKTYFGFLLVLSLLIFCTSCQSDPSRLSAQRDLLFQQSTIHTLLAGVYDGEISFGQLKEYGDFGIGTLDALDGEMVAVDGTYYQIKADGKVYPVSDSLTTPFASVTFFETDQQLTILDSLDNAGICQWIDQNLKSLNFPYAIQIRGHFSKVKARSVPKQVKPYMPLVQIVEDQPIFEFSDTQGIMIGFRLPDYLQDLNVPGYHFHFLTEDRTQGGHVLDFTGLQGEIWIDYTPSLQVVLSEQQAFYDLTLKEDRSEQLEKVEK